MALGLRAGEEGVEIVAEARCHQPQYAKRLRENLNLMVLVGRLALQGRNDETAQMLGGALKNLTLTQQDDAVRARLLLPPDKVAWLLREAPTAARKR
jgi:hypothetical protein